MVQHRHAVGGGHGLFLVVGDEDGGDAQPPLQRQQVLAHLHPQLLVQVGQGLVQQQHLRLDDDGARQRHALLLATGQLVGTAPPEVGQTHEFERGGDLVADLGARQAPLDQAEGNVVPHRHVRPQRIVLEHHADIAVPGRRGADVAAVDQQLPMALPVEAGDQAQQGGFARSRRAEQGEEFAGLDMDADVLEDFVPAIGKPDVAAFDADFLHEDSPLRAGRWRAEARSTSK
ncbi:Uncharacterised protein [Bordetella pertussis]|nr:Uncharacterised protein [Bordetella pertussis]